jgi:hypothetical protein
LIGGREKALTGGLGNSLAQSHIVAGKGKLHGVRFATCVSRASVNCAPEREADNRTARLT